MVVKVPLRDIFVKGQPVVGHPVRGIVIADSSGRFSKGESVVTTPILHLNIGCVWAAADGSFDTTSGTIYTYTVIR